MSKRKGWKAKQRTRRARAAWSTYVRTEVRSLFKWADAATARKMRALVRALVPPAAMLRVRE